MNARNTLQQLSPGQRMAAARAAASGDMPYFEAAIRDLVPYETDVIPTMAVTKTQVLMYNPEFLAGMTAREAGAVLIHEYLHIFLRHADRAQKLFASGVLQDNAADRYLWNVAADLEINDDLEEAGLPLPTISYKDAEGKSHTSPPVTPKNQGFIEGKTAEQYVHWLLEKRDGQKSGSVGQPPPGGWGQCGSGAGNPQPGEADGDAAGEMEAIGRDEVEQDMGRKAAAVAIQANAKQAGNVPAGLLREALALDGEGKVRWEDKLANLVQCAVDAYTVGQGEYTFQVRNFHQPGLDELYGEDAPLLPGEHAPQARAAIGIDTSGSISTEDLRMGCLEAKGLLDAMAGVSVRLIVIDCAVHVSVDVQSVEEIVSNLKGGGGTDFRPLFAELEKEKPYDLLLFVTDGYGPAPAEPPPHTHVIWLITPGGTAPATWGECVWLDDADEQRHAQRAA